MRGVPAVDSGFEPGALWPLSRDLTPGPPRHNIRIGIWQMRKKNERDRCNVVNKMVNDSPRL
ncbi:hypothetical protein AVEN_132720-1, partial [Araneus ventricosus]